MDKTSTEKLNDCDGLFRSSQVDESSTFLLNVGKSGKPPIQVVFAKYSTMYYYMENSKYEGKSGDERSNIMVFRIGVHIENNRLMMDKGYNRRTSECFYKSSRHAAEIKQFFENSIENNRGTVTIWDKPNSKKDSGYIVLNYNCGIDSDDERAQLAQLTDTEGTHLDFLIIESSAQPVNQGMKSVRETKQTMLFGSDIKNFEKWTDDVIHYEKEVKTEIVKARSLGGLIQSCGDILETEKNVCSSTLTKKVKGNNNHVKTKQKVSETNLTGNTNYVDNVITCDDYDDDDDDDDDDEGNYDNDDENGTESNDEIIELDDEPSTSVSTSEKGDITAEKVTEKVRNKRDNNGEIKNGKLKLKPSSEELLKDKIRAEILAELGETGRSKKTKQM